MGRLVETECVYWRRERESEEDSPTKHWQSKPRMELVECSICTALDNPSSTCKLWLARLVDFATVLAVQE